jgi:hypothetical protein
MEVDAPALTLTLAALPIQTKDSLHALRAVPAPNSAIASRVRVVADQCAAIADHNHLRSFTTASITSVSRLQVAMLLPRSTVRKSVAK